MNHKLILVFYFPSFIEIDEYNTQRASVNEYLLKEFGEENKPVTIFAITDGETRIECINPVVLNEEQFKQYDEIITAVKNSEEFNKLKGEQTDN